MKLCIALITAALLTLVAPTLARAADDPETVMITSLAKADADKALADVIARHYASALRLGMLQPGAAHVTLKVVDADGKLSFVEIFTWRDGSVPDAAPNEIRALWERMSGLVESRGGRPGLDIARVTTITREK